MSRRPGLPSDAEREMLERIDRELHSMLSIEPSPTVRQRVRARIETLTPRSLLWRWAWLVPASAAVVFAFAIGPAIFQPAQPPRIADTIPDPPRPALGSEKAPPSNVARGHVAPKGVSARSRSNARRPVASQVLISKDEQAAWRQFLAFAAAGSIEVQATPIAEVAPVESLIIAALDFEGPSTGP